MSSSPKSCSLGKNTHTRVRRTAVSGHKPNSKGESFHFVQKAHVSILNCSDSWKHWADKPGRAHYLSWALPEEWYWRSRRGDTVQYIHNNTKPPPSSFTEWHFPLICLCFFGTQLAKWPLIRQGASRAQTVTVERSIFWERSSNSGRPYCTSLGSMKAVVVWKTHWGGGEASAGIHSGNGSQIDGVD